MALTKIEDKEIMTVWEATLKYTDKYMLMIRTERVDDGDEDKGYVSYIYDEEIESLQIPRVEIEASISDGQMAMWVMGYSADTGIQIGGIEIHEHV